jgi:hypothetical protein
MLLRVGRLLVPLTKIASHNHPDNDDCGNKRLPSLALKSKPRRPARQRTDRRFDPPLRASNERPPSTSPRTCSAGPLEKSNFPRHLNAIWVVQSPIAKIFRFSINPNQWLPYAIPFPERGARDRHERWKRDAMDVEVCETNAPTRTTKLCGPGAPTLALSSWSGGRRWQKSPVTEEQLC